MKEPSILDYLKSRLNPWQKEKVEIPHSDVLVDAERNNDLDSSTIETVPATAATAAQPSEAGEDGVREMATPKSMFSRRPWRTFAALVLAIIAQRFLEPPVDSFVLPLSLYIIALGLLVWAYIVREFALPDPEEVPSQIDPQTYRRNALVIAIFLAIAAFILFTDNMFTFVNVSLWLAAIGLFIGGLWLSETATPPLFQRLVDFFKRDQWHPSITRLGVFVVVIVAVIVFFRIYRLDGVIGEPFSDHAEKLLDVFDVTQGQTHIFFPRNTGREFLQFYWTAVISFVFGTGLTFISLKIGTALIGLFTLPYVYLLGREIGGKRVALFALILAGTSYWLNTISRIGLRFPLYPAFTAPALYYLIRGLRRQNRNDFILSGLFLGLGLNGYSPFRVVPFVVLAGVGLYLLHRQSVGNRKQTLMMFSVLILASFLVFLPLMRYAIDNPDMFSYRTMTRLVGEGQPLPGPAWQIFISNTFNAMTMFNYDNGEIWVHSIPNRPALDVVSAVLFVFGYLLLLVRYLVRRHWLDLFIFLSVPLLLMPSILSLAFPNENPSLNRTAGAAVLVFIIAALALDGLYRALQSMSGVSRRQGFAAGVVIILLLMSARQNFTLVFDTFSTQFMLGAWNTSDMGNVIRSFVAAGNSPDNAFVVPYPYWVDTRLVGIQAGYPTKDYALSRDDLSKTQAVAGSKLFIVKDEDKDTLTALAGIYPSGQVGHFTSPIEGKNFWIYSVPDNQTLNP